MAEKYDYKGLGGGGSAKPEKPVSHRTDGAAGGGSGLKHNASAAASHLREQDKCVPDNDGPMVKAHGSKSIA